MNEEVAGSLPTDDPQAAVVAYHQRSKHQLDRYAAALGYLDWDTQPDPFRRFDGAPLLPLDHPPDDEPPRYDDLFRPGRIAAAPVTRESISRLCYDSLAIAAWKTLGQGKTWSLRVNPSSGALHPTEGYLVCPPLPGLHPEPAVFHYAPHEHSLELRRNLPAAAWQHLAAQLPPGSLLAGLSSIYWRESWKYGERAFRYCHHDAGHAIGCFALAAAALGWRTRLATGLNDDQLAILLGTDRQQGMEAEHVDAVVIVSPEEIPDAANQLTLPDSLVEAIAAAELQGEPRALSSAHHEWPVIDEVSRATHYDGSRIGRESASSSDSTSHEELVPTRDLPARRIFRQRRSAVEMDGQTSIDAATFYGILARVTPGLTPFPFDVLDWPAEVSLGLFVHRVTGLEPGLYLLARDKQHQELLQPALRAEFVWRKPAGCPAELPLYLLKPGDVRHEAKLASCHQDIAADGAFALCMLARFEPALAERGPWFYARLHWETGLIGQVLYLEAEAAGVRSTGMGCFHDDVMHDLLGIRDIGWQSLYHFTVGGPLDDPRLQTLPAYGHLDR